MFVGFAETGATLTVTRAAERDAKDRNLYIEPSDLYLNKLLLPPAHNTIKLNQNYDSNKLIVFIVSNLWRRSLYSQIYKQTIKRFYR